MFSVWSATDRVARGRHDVKSPKITKKHYVHTFFCIRDVMIWLTRGIPYYFQNFDSFYPLFSPKKTHPLCITSLIFPKTRGIPYYFQNFDSFYP